MSVLNRRLLPTPRLLVVGSVVLGVGACHRNQPVSAPPPVPASAPTRNPTPAPVPRQDSASGSIAITSGESVIRSMYQRYAATWYRNLTFVQKTTLVLSSGGEVVQTWYEAGQMPGRLRIDTDLRSKGGVLYAGDSTYNFAAGKLVRADTGLNVLLLLSFGVYSQEPSRTEAHLRRSGFDLTRFHEDTWHGMPVYVVGAARGDTTSKQFWVDRDRLLFVRLLENTRQGRADFRISGYVQAGGGWVATEVEQYVNGKRRLLQQYSQIRTNVTLSDALFDPGKWATASHWVP
jgi:hypothetical protein